jgi:hypothetical protein
MASLIQTLVIGVDLRLRRLLRLELRGHLPRVVEDRVDRANVAAQAAIDAERRVDHVQLLARPGDAFHRAFLGAGRAADAGVDDGVGHVGRDYSGWGGIFPIRRNFAESGLHGRIPT